MTQVQVHLSLRCAIILPPNFRVNRESLDIGRYRVQSLPYMLERFRCLPSQLLIAKPQPNEMSSAPILLSANFMWQQTIDTHVCCSSSWNASRECNKPRLFIYWISPFWKFNPKEWFSAVKCRASRASAWASDIGGICELRSCKPYPVKCRREYWITICPSSLYRSGRVVYPGDPPKLSIWAHILDKY